MLYYFFPFSFYRGLQSFPCSSIKTSQPVLRMSSGRPRRTCMTIIKNDVLLRARRIFSPWVLLVKQGTCLLYSGFLWPTHQFNRLSAWAPSSFFFLLFLHFHLCGFLFYFVYNLNFPLYELRQNVVQSILFSWLLLKSMGGWWITSVLLIGILHPFSDLDCIFLWELWGADPRSVCSCWAYNFVNVGTGLVI